MYLRQSTASQSRATPPFLDSTDFQTAETGLTIANTDVKIVMNGGASADKNSGGGTHRANGVYGLTFDATDTATVGEMEVSIKVAGALPVFMKFWVLEEAVYDALFAASAPGYVANAPVNVAQFGGSNGTFASGRPEVNVSHYGGTAGTFSSGRPEVNATHLAGTAYATQRDALVDLVWDEVLSGATHNVSGSAGRRLREITNSVVTSGTAQAGSTNTITLASGASSTDGTYDPAIVRISGGTGSGQSRLIIHYTGSTRVAVVDRDWRTAPDSTSEYEIIASPNLISTNEGLAQGGASTTITLNANASSTNNIYVGQTVVIRTGTGQDQSRIISAYNGTTKVATVAQAWTTNPDSSSGYIIWPLGRALLVAAETGSISSSSFASGALDAVWSTASRTLTAGTNIQLPSNGLANVTAWTVAITGNITGNLSGSVGSIASGGITSGSFGSGAITAAAIASDAITDAKVASDVTIASVTGSVGSIATGGISSASFAAGAIDAAAIAANAIGASELAADAVAEIQSGLSTLDAAGVRSAVGLASANLDTQLLNIVTDTNELQTDWANGGRLDLLIDGIVADLPQRITKNTALAAFTFFMVDSADHVSGKTGLTITATRSLDGAAFGACANSATEISNGWYKIDLAAGDLNGNTVALKFTATGADARNITIVTQPT